MGLYQYLFSLLNEDERCLQITPSIFLERTDEGNELNIDTDLVGASMEVKSIKSDDEFVIINETTTVHVTADDFIEIKFGASDIYNLYPLTPRMVAKIISDAEVEATFRDDSGEILRLVKTDKGIMGQVKVRAKKDIELTFPVKGKSVTYKKCDEGYLFEIDDNYTITLPECSVSFSF